MPDAPPTLYKVLIEGMSCHGGTQTWDLPVQNDDDSWTPGAWVRVAGPLVMCEHGIHVTDAPDKWWMSNSTLWGVETEGVILEDGSNKRCCEAVRLTQPANWADHGIHVVTEGHHVARDGQWYASGSSHVEAWGSSHVEAWGSSHVVASESSHVVASGSSHVVASESSHVEAWGSSHVVAWGSSHVEAWGSSHVVASESSHVVASGSSHVVASGSSHVVASGSSHVVASGSSAIESTIYHSPSAIVALHHMAAHIDRRGEKLILRGARGGDHKVPAEVPA